MANTPGTKNEHSDAAVGSMYKQLLVQHNLLVTAVAKLGDNLGGTGNVTVVTPTIGTTVTVAVPASTIMIAGVPSLLTAETAKAFGALGTIPNAKWGIITMERIANSTTTFVSGAHNYDTGYDTEAAAIAAIPAISANKVRVGYLTVQSTAQAAGWIAGTDALAGGTGGSNPAQTTNYYPGVGLFDTSVLNANLIKTATGGTIVYP